MRFFKPNVPKLREARDTSRLIKALRDRDSKIRRAAVDALGDIGDSRAAEPLRAALHDTDSIVCCWAIKALAKIDGRNAVEPLCGLLDHREGVVRLTTVEVLADIDDSRTRQALAGALHDSWIAVSFAAARGFDRIGLPDDPAIRSRYIIVLTEALAEDDSLSQPAGIALVKIGAAAVGGICRSLESERDRLRWRTAEVLGEIRSPEAVRPLCKALSTRDARSTVRDAAGKALVRIGATAVGPLVELLAVEERDVRDRANWALEKIDPKWAKSEAARTAVPALVAALKRIGWPELRVAVVQALHQIGDPSSVGPLVVAFTDEEQKVRQLADTALKEIDPKWAQSEAARAALPALVAALQSSKRRELRVGVVQALRQIGDPGSVGPLIVALADEADEVRAVANTALMELDPKWMKSEAARAVVPELAAALKAEGSGSRLAAVEALRQIGDPGAIGPLIVALTDFSDEVRAVAGATLAELDPNWMKSQAGREAVPGLVAKFWSPSEGIKAVQVLRQIGKPDAVAPLVKALNSSYKAVREAANTALTELDPNWENLEAARVAVPFLIEACNIAYNPEATDTRNPEATSALLRIIRSGNIEERWWQPAVCAVVEHGCAELNWYLELGAAAVEPLLAMVGSESFPRRRAAAETLVRIYREGGLDEPARLKILGLRPMISAKHVDNNYQTGHGDFGTSNDCDHHSDQAEYRHEDGGIGVAFNPNY